MDHLMYKQQLQESLTGESAFEVHKLLRERMDHVFTAKMADLTEGEEMNHALEIQMAAKSFGGEDSDEQNGVIVIYFRSKQAVDHFTTFLENCPYVETYEINGSMKNRETDSTDAVMDFDSITDDRMYEFQVIVYMLPEFSHFTDDIDEDGDVDDADLAFASDELGEGVVAEADKKEDDKASDDKEEDDEASDDEASDDKEIKEADEADKKEDDKASDDKEEDDEASDDEASDDKEDDKKEESVQHDGEQIDEVLRKVVIRSGAGGAGMSRAPKKMIKMTCPKGFKWDPSISACVKIGGQELATKRKASRRALITKRSEGSVFKVRFKRKLLRSFKFRKMMGMKV